MFNLNEINKLIYFEMYCLFKKNYSDTWFYSRMLRKNEYCQKGHQKKENKTDQPNS